MLKRYYSLGISLLVIVGLLFAAGCSGTEGTSAGSAPTVSGQEPQASQMDGQEEQAEVSGQETSEPAESRTEADPAQTGEGASEPAAPGSLSGKSTEENETSAADSLPEAPGSDPGAAGIPEDAAPLVILMRPVERFDVDGWVYYHPDDQETWIAALKEATASRTGSERQEGGYCGFYLEYQDTYYTVIDDSCLAWKGSKSTPEGSATLMTMLAELRKEYDYYPITPEEISDITSASFHYGGETLSITDPEALSYIESTLSQATWHGTLTSCGYCSKLDMTTASGKTISVAIATDGCGMFLTAGICYRFGSDNDELYEKLLGMTREEYRQKMKEKT